MSSKVVVIVSGGIFFPWLIYEAVCPIPALTVALSFSLPVHRRTRASVHFSDTHARVLIQQRSGSC